MAEKDRFSIKNGLKTRIFGNHGRVTIFKKIVLPKKDYFTFKYLDCI
jgi:hypothetical protein